jgi:hypothetical protein
MGVLHNSKVHEHGIMLLGIRILWFVNKGSKGCKCARFFLHMVMERGKVDGANAFLKQEIHKEQIKAHAMRLQNAHDVVTFCQQHVGVVVKFYYLHLS